MRAKIIVATGIAFCFGLILVWYFHPKRLAEDSASVTNARNETSGTQNSKSATTALNNVSDTQSNWANQPLPSGSNLQERMEELSRQRGIPLNILTQQALAHMSNGVKEWNEKLNRPIEFYGKVVDENEQPIDGVSISFLYNRFAPPAGSFHVNILSDTNGLFSLSGVTGSALSVYVDKNGYYPSRSANQNHFNYTESLGDVFYPDRNNPIIFHLRKKGEGAELITSQNGMRPYLAISGLRDGSSQRVDFFTQKVGNEGQLELSAIKPLPDQPQSGWSFKMSIPDGGFIEENDEFPFEAPESGYNPTAEFSFQAGTTNWTDSIDKSFYIEFGNPPKYGRIHVKTSIRTGTMFEYAINPTGSRNLQPSEPQPQPPQGAPPGSQLVTPQFQ